MTDPRSFSRLLGFLLVGIAATAAYAQSPADHVEHPQNVDTSRTAPVQLQHQFRPGDSNRFQLQVQVETTPYGRAIALTPSYTMRVPFTVQTQAHSGRRTNLFVWTFGTEELRFTGSPRPEDVQRFRDGLQGSRVQRVINDTGERVETRLAARVDDAPFSPHALLVDLTNLAVPVFPAEEIRIGDAWVQDFSLAYADAEGTYQGGLRAEYTFAGYTLADGREQILIRVRYDARYNGPVVVPGRTTSRLDTQGRGQGDGYLLVDPRTGALHAHHFTLGVVMYANVVNTPRTTQLVRITGSIRRP